jgi:hypothetical protein
MKEAYRRKFRPPTLLRSAMAAILALSYVLPAVPVAVQAADAPDPVVQGGKLSPQYVANGVLSDLDKLGSSTTGSAGAAPKSTIGRSFTSDQAKAEAVKLASEPRYDRPGNRQKAAVDAAYKIKGDLWGKGFISTRLTADGVLVTVTPGTKVPATVGGVPVQSQSSTPASIRTLYSAIMAKSWPPISPPAQI